MTSIAFAIFGRARRTAFATLASSLLMMRAIWRADLVPKPRDARLGCSVRKRRRSLSGSLLMPGGRAYRVGWVVRPGAFCREGVREGPSRYGRRIGRSPWLAGRPLELQK